MKQKENSKMTFSLLDFLSLKLLFVELRHAWTMNHLLTSAAIRISPIDSRNYEKLALEGAAAAKDLQKCQQNFVYN